ncbi:unnamed protein product [Ceutorhynchus assimilis]|uniref:Uncharacterized protein n=1 Tax=Ceutorhynchus assimilis TaxID=467358 RepID=A0A9N9MK20_9CUCU|nr:unnamed protein product [Ceutorhynchus assimilis]
MAQSLINDIIAILLKKRNNVKSSFKLIFEEAEEMHKKINIPILVDRTNARQRHRPNYNTNNPVDNFRISNYIPLLDDVIEDLKFRFSSDLFTILEITELIPSNILKKADIIDYTATKNTIAKYLSQFTNECASKFGNIRKKLFLLETAKNLVAFNHGQR